jgi:hypothetical protein
MQYQTVNTQGNMLQGQPQPIIVFNVAAIKMTRLTEKKTELCLSALMTAQYPACKVEFSHIAQYYSSLLLISLNFFTV